MIAACAQYGKACGTQLIGPISKTSIPHFPLVTFVVLASDIFCYGSG